MNNSTTAISSFVFPQERPGNVTSKNDIKISSNSKISQHIKNVHSEFGGVFIDSDNPEEPYFVTGKIHADKNIEIRNAVIIDANIESKFGNVKLEGCLIGANVKAHKELTTINCDQASEKYLTSEFSNVNLINSNAGHVKAHKDISIDHLSTYQSTHSNFGTVFDQGTGWQYPTRVSNPDLNGFSNVNDLIAIISNYYPPTQQLPTRPALTNGNTRGNELVRVNTPFSQQPSWRAIANPQGNELVPANTQFPEQLSRPAITNGNEPTRDPREHLKNAMQQFLSRR
ncbi:hypothetical protein ACL2XO_15145 [Sodalis sp. RH15]|uniref:hypothetical protein n=1 Tax=Sodalis sp. RH15 TaxID=3394330 RepID=UPI0039B689B8